MNSRYGAAPTQTPPKPTSMPLTRFSPSMKTVRLSNLPSPLVSSKIRMRSFALSARARAGDRCNASATQSRPRSSMAKAIGCIDVRLAGEERGLEAVGHRHGLRRPASGGRPANLYVSAEATCTEPGDGIERSELGLHRRSGSRRN